MRKGSRVSLRPTGLGVRGYLALAGGIEAEPFLGSTCVDRIGLIGRPLAPGDVLGLAREATPGHEMQARPQERPFHVVIRLHRGPQWSQEAEDALTAAPFTVTTGDRMGVRLEGPEVPGRRAAARVAAARRRPGARRAARRSCCSPTASAAPATTSPPSSTPTTSRSSGQLQPEERLRFAFVGDHPVPWFRDL